MRNFEQNSCVSDWEVYAGKTACIICIRITFNCHAQKIWMHPHVKVECMGEREREREQDKILAANRNGRICMLRRTITDRLPYIRITTLASSNRSRKQPRTPRIPMDIIYLYRPGGQFVHTWWNCAMNARSSRREMLESCLTSSMRIESDTYISSSLHQYRRVCTRINICIIANVPMYKERDSNIVCFLQKLSI